MSKSRSRSPSRRFPKKSRNHDDLNMDESDKSKYIDLREKLNDMRRPKDKQALKQEQDSKKTLKNESNSEAKSEIKTEHGIRSKRILKEAEVSVVVSEEESDVEFEAGTAENSESIVNSAKRFKSRSRTVSKETVTDTDTDTETRSNTPRRSSVNDEIENPSERNEAIKGDFRSRSVSSEMEKVPGETEEVKMRPRPEMIDEGEQTTETMADPITYFCATKGCRSVEEFECLNKIEEGAYGVVFRAKDKKTNEQVALKRLKMEKEKDGFPITSLREVDTLLKCRHPNIVSVREIVVGSNMDKIYMVMEFVEHDLKSLMQYGMKNPFLMSEVKCLMLQLLSGIVHLHDNWIIHRDLKTSNLLLSHKGILKIADFGLAREYGSPLKEYTPIVVTLWYRSPELLLNTKKYSIAVDMWSVGCIFGELMLMKALFPGKNEKDQLDKIFKDLGTPADKIWPGFRDLPLAQKLNFPNFPYNTLRSRFGKYLSDKGFELINKLLTYDPHRRITAEDALKHDFFKETPKPIDPSIFPTWPAKSEGLSRKKMPQDSEPKAPSAGKMYEKLLEDEGFVLHGSVAPFQLRM